MLRRAFLATPLLTAAIWKDGPPGTFEAEILKLMEVVRVPGAVIGTLHGGKPRWTRALGVRDLETQAAVQMDSIFQAASLSKQCTAYAAFALRSQGKLDFDKPLTTYVDDLEDPAARTVTARHVLSHSSGFPNWRGNAGQKLVASFAPGTKFQYSGEGYFYLQRAMEEVTGVGFGQLMNALVFQPLKMESTSMIWKAEWTERYALPHDRRGLARSGDKIPRRPQPAASWKYAEYEAATREIGLPSLPNFIVPNAASSMITCAPDYARFVAAAMTNPELRKAQINIRPGLGWGLGWGIERIPGGRQYLWQWGDNGGFKNFVACEPATGDAIFVFTNGDSGARVYDRIVTRATGHQHPALSWI